MKTCPAIHLAPNRADIDFDLYFTIQNEGSPPRKSKMFYDFGSRNPSKTMVKIESLKEVGKRGPQSRTLRTHMKIWCPRAPKWNQNPSQIGHKSHLEADVVPGGAQTHPGASKMIPQTSKMSPQTSPGHPFDSKMMPTCTRHGPKINLKWPGTDHTHAYIEMC